MKKRLFVAAEIPESMVNDFNTYQQTLSLSDASWTKEESYHLTIAFLGYVDEENIVNVEKELALISSRTKPFELHYESSVLAPPGKDARMIWAKLAPSDNFSNLVGEIYSNVRSYITEQVRTERIPHITLARFREGVAVNEGNLLQPQLSLRSFNISEIDLFESKPSSFESEYTKLSSFKLEG